MTGSAEERQVRKTRRTAVAGGILLALLVLLGTAIWLGISRPTLWLPLLNRQLPEGLEIVAAEGLRPGPRGIGWRMIELQWQDQTLRLERGHARWHIHRLRPLDAQLLHFETRRLIGTMAPPRDAPADQWEPLPRFWEQPWWPVLSALSGTIDRIDIHDHSGKPVLSGALHWRQGAQQGGATLSLADMDITLEWAPGAGDTGEPSWDAHWQTHGLLRSDGAVRLRWMDDHLAFRLLGELREPLPDALGADALPINAEGRIDLFADTDQLLLGNWEIQGKYPMGDTPLDWHCHGLMVLPANLSPEPELTHCELTSTPIAGKLLGPIALDWQRLALTWERDLELKLVGPFVSGALYIGGQGCALDEDCELPLQLNLYQGSWNGLAWSAGEASARLTRAGSDNSLHLTETTLNLASLDGDGFRLREVSLSLADVTLWRPELSQWHIERLEAGALVQLDEAGAELALRGTLAELEVAAPDQWSTRLELALDPRWQGQTLPTLYLDQQWRQAGDVLSAIGTLTSGALGTLLDHQLSFAPERPPQFTARLDGSAWPEGADITTALLGRDSPLLPIRGLHGVLMADIAGTWTDSGLHLEVRGQADRLAGLYEQYAFAGASLAPFHLRWGEAGLHTVEPLRWQVEDFNVGLVLNGLEGRLSLTNTDWQLSEVSGELLGGRFRLDHLTADESGTLRLESIDLAAAIALMNQPDISVNGKLSGRLPVALENGSPVVREGELRNDEPGVIRYRPAPGSDFLRGNPQTALVGDTLGNFHYQRLEADVSYRANGDLLLFTRLQGRNPDLEGSPPIHLNLNVEQNIPSLLRSLRAGEDIGAWLERRVMPER